MATKKTAPKNFGSLANNIFSEAQPPQAAEVPVKAKLTSFELEADLKLLLDRVVFWEGKKGTQKSVINAALRAYFAVNPNSQRPTPDEL
jgi:hypothetical protein